MHPRWSSASPWAGPSHCPATGPATRPATRPASRSATRPASRSARSLSAEVGGGPPSSSAPSAAAWPPLCPRAQGGLLPLSGVPPSILERPSFDMPGGRHKLNPSQTAAVREALKKQFAVIQGPPGGAPVGAAGAGAGGGGCAHPRLSCRHGEDRRGLPHCVLASQVQRGAAAGRRRPLHPVLRPLQQVGGRRGRCAGSAAWGLCSAVPGPGAGPSCPGCPQDCS